MNTVNTIPIIVTGKGLVPRTGRIAPILRPFPVTKHELMTIVRTPKTASMIQAHYVDPDNGYKIAIDAKNVDKVWADYCNKINQKRKQIDEQSNQIKMEEYLKEVKEEKIEEKTFEAEIQTEETISEEVKEDEILPYIPGKEDKSEDEQSSDEVVDKENEVEVKEDKVEETHSTHSQYNTQQYRKNNKHNKR